MGLARNDSEPGACEARGVPVGASRLGLAAAGVAVCWGVSVPTKPTKCKEGKVDAVGEADSPELLVTDAVASLALTVTWGAGFVALADMWGAQVGAG